MYLALLLLLLVAGILPLSIYLVNQMHQPPAPSSNILDAEAAIPSGRQQTQDWWEQKRARFNQILIIAGLAAFILYHHLAQSGSISGILLNTNAYILFLQLLAYLLYMGVANLFFNFGPILEINSQSKSPEQFRRRLFQIITGITVLIPLATALTFYLAGT